MRRKGNTPLLEERIDSFLGVDKKWKAMEMEGKL